MKRINMLPERLVLTRERARRWIVVVLFSAAVIPVFGGWGWAARSHLRHLDAQIAAAERDLEHRQGEGVEFERLREEKRSLNSHMRTVEELREPISTAAILALLTQLAPEEVVFRSLQIEIPLPTLAAGPERAAQTPERAAASRAAKRDDASHINAASIELQLEGMASVDAAIAQLMGNLTESGVFRNVRLNESREIAFASQSGHQFRISMDIPMLAIAKGSLDATGDDLEDSRVRKIEPISS